jgi:hypothetical protein
MQDFGAASRTLIWIDLSTIGTVLLLFAFSVNGFGSGHERQIGDGGSL